MQAEVILVSELSPMEFNPVTSAHLVPLAPISLWLKPGKDRMYLHESWCLPAQLRSVPINLACRSKQPASTRGDAPTRDSAD